MTATTPSQPASDPGRNVTTPCVEFSLDDKLPGKTVAESAGIIVPDNAPGGKAQRFDSSAYTPDGGRDHSRTGGESTSDLWTADADYEGYEPEEYWQH